MAQEPPLVSVIIVNHNGIEFVDACLRSVLRNNYSNFEVIFVDNASKDGSLEYVKMAFGGNPRLVIVENEGSLGPAVGRNIGISRAKGKYIAFLDNDTDVEASWLSELVRVLESDFSIGAAQSKLLRLEPKDEFDSAGEYLTSFGFLSERARSARDRRQFDYICDIFSGKSAALIIKKEVLDKIGGFDEDFYMYLEETDICWRVWLAGYRVVFIPSSVVYHAYGTRKKEQKKYYPNYIVRYYGCRNYISTLIKNLGLAYSIKMLPLQILSFLVLAFIFLVRGRLNDAYLLIKGVLWNFVNLAPILQKRNIVQKTVRKVSDADIAKKVFISPPLSYYFGKAIAYSGSKPY